MNERIKKLGMQAGLMTGEKEQLFFCRPIAQFDEYSPEIEKFAELIIKQCCSVVDAQNYYVYGGDVKKLILEHFGIEP